MAELENYFLTVLSPIDYVRGGSQKKLEDLQRFLDALPSTEPYEAEDERAKSPFSSTSCVHRARFLIIDEIPVQMGNVKSGRLASKYLLFIAELDGERDDFLKELYKKRTETVRNIWGNCVQFPEPCSPELFCKYMQVYEIKSTLPFSAYSGISQQKISKMLKVRRTLTDFVVDNQASETNELYDAWQVFKNKVETLGIQPKEQGKS